MKLELKHLTPYLLHNLMLMIDGVVCEIEGFDLYQIDTVIAERVSYNISAVKPILRPLSDLTKEIEENGEKFVPNRWIYDNIRRGVDIYRPININYPLELNIDTEDYSQCIDLYDGFTITQKLLEWHFDIYRLIEQDLAIDINDLKKSL